MDKFSLKVMEKALGKDVSKIEALLIMEGDGTRSGGPGHEPDRRDLQKTRRAGI